jgi:hypothetical protein
MPEEKSYSFKQESSFRSSRGDEKMKPTLYKVAMTVPLAVWTIILGLMLRQ